MGDVFRQEFFSQISEVKIFFLTYNGVRFFFSIIYVMREIFSIAGYNFSQVYPCKLFPSKSVYMIFFFKSPITSSKVKLPSAKIHPNIDSERDLSVIAKAFWNNRGQNSLGERGRNSFLLTPTRRVRTDVRWRIVYHFLLSMELHARAPVGYAEAPLLPIVLRKV